MEFTTTISEQVYLDAQQLAGMNALRKVNSILFYALLLLILLANLFAFINEHTEFGAACRTQNPSIVKNYTLPVDALFLGYILLYKVFVPYRIRRSFRKDLGQQGENVVQLSLEGVSEKSSRSMSDIAEWRDEV